MISIENLSVQFSGDFLFKNVSIKIYPTDKIGVAGPNGCGKTTLLRIIAGLQSYESGNINYQKGIKIGYLPQDYVSEISNITLIEEVYSSNTEIYNLEKREAELLQKIKISPDENYLHELGDVHHNLERLGWDKYKSDCQKILLGLGFKEKDFPRDVAEFSGGWRMRIALAKLLVAQNDIILLDEPTNHLDLDSLEFVISYFKGYKGALIIVSHDRFFLNQVTNKTLGFIFGDVNLLNGNIQHFLEIQEIRREQIIATQKNQQLKIKQLERFIERFRYKATKARQVQSRIKMLDKIDKVEILEDDKEISFNFNNAPHSGKVVMKIEELTKKYDDIIIENAELEIERGDKIAFLGANGTGKTTLAKILAGIEPFNSGKRIQGHNVMIGYYSQDAAENLVKSINVLETVENIDPTKTTGDLRTLLGCFLFHGDDVYKKVDVLSGGEKSRLAIAKILLQPCNFLIMDEPTNHLDIQSKKILQEALIDYNGTLLIVSHDVEFLSPVINKIIEIKDKKPKMIVSSIDDYLVKYETENIEEEIISNKEKKIDAKKIQKRLEAERRNEFYKLTKDIKEKITSLESEIFKYEDEKKTLEHIMSDAAFSERKDKAELMINYKNINATLDEKYIEWEKLNTEFIKIQNEFQSRTE